MSSPSTNTITRRVVTDRGDCNSPVSSARKGTTYTPGSAMNLTNNSMTALGEERSVHSGSPTRMLQRSDTIESDSFLEEDSIHEVTPSPCRGQQPKTTKQDEKRSSNASSDFVEEALSEEESPMKRRPTTTTSSGVMIKTSSTNPIASSSPKVGRLPVMVNWGKKEAIGRGTFGTVYKAMDMQSNRMIAVKEISLPPGRDSAKQLNLIEREVALLEKMVHPNVVHCLGHLRQEEESKFLIYMECVSGGTIRSMLKSFGPLHENQASRFTEQVLQGLNYLHGNKVAHRDLKGENLLFDMDGTVKLGDFGAAKELQSTMGNTVAGTPQFMAPEVAQGSTYGLAADIWSLGCCVAEMCTGQSPFIGFGKNQFAVMAKIAEIEDIPIPLNVTLACREFLGRCLVKDPRRRASCEELLNMRWITQPPSLDDSTAMVKSVTVRSSSDNSASSVEALRVAAISVPKGGVGISGAGGFEGITDRDDEENTVDLGSTGNTFNPVVSYGSQ